MASTSYEIHIWSRNADAALPDRIIRVPVDNDDAAADAWERHYSQGVRVEIHRITRGLREVLKAAF